MKKFLITTMLGIATTAAFGAASLRAPQMGGTATVATPTATNTARAGTLRAQTMKTSSVSTPASVTITQSIAAPVSTETTDARIALLKGIKGFNPGKVKDTSATQQELNNIDSRIEELQSKLDAAESAQATVLTEDTIDNKITANVAEKTYTKSEIDNLLSAIDRKLPKIDDKGNMTWTDPNGNLVVWSPFHLYYTKFFSLFDELVYNAYLPNTEQSVEKIRNWVRTTCERWDTMNPGELLNCKMVIHGTDAIHYDSEAGFWWFTILKVYTGYKEYQDPEVFTTPYNMIVFRKFLESFEYDTAEKFYAAACEGRSADECQVFDFQLYAALSNPGKLYRATVDYIYAAKNSGE